MFYVQAKNIRGLSCGFVDRILTLWAVILRAPLLLPLRSIPDAIGSHRPRAGAEIRLSERHH
jgi:hypothetical protein